MKKFLSLILVLLLIVISLVACSENTEKKNSNDDEKIESVEDEKVAEEKKEETDENEENTDGAKEEVKRPEKVEEIATGTIIDEPEVTVSDNVDEFYVYFTASDENSEVVSYEIAVKQLTNDSYAVYCSDGLLKNHEIIYEVTDSGITKYYSDIFMAGFEPDNEISADDAQNEMLETLLLGAYFTLEHPMYEGIKYRKSDAIAATLTGDAYVYDLIDGENAIGEIYVDKETGFVVRINDESGTITVTNFKTSDVQLPEYK